MSAWTKPREDVTGLDAAFGPRSTDDLMPPMAEIPVEFKDFNRKNKWTDLQEHWFFSGLKGATWIPKDGVDQKAAVTHLAAIQRSWEPKHEHKRAAVAYLASLWFDDVSYERAS